jgi:hypothetical protein
MMKLMYSDNSTDLEERAQCLGVGVICARYVTGLSIKRCYPSFGYAIPKKNLQLKTACRSSPK